MVQHARLIFYSLLLLVIPCESTLAQKIPVTPIDSLITVGYATGSLKTLSGSVEKITETQMNKDQITNPLEAIRGRVPGLTIQRGSNGPAALDAVRLRGTTSLTSGNDPLIIVDGVFGDLSMLTSIYPTDIQCIPVVVQSVLADRLRLSMKVLMYSFSFRIEWRNCSQAEAEQCILYHAGW